MAAYLRVLKNFHDIFHGVINVNLVNNVSGFLLSHPYRYLLNISEI